MSDKESEILKLIDERDDAQKMCDELSSRIAEICKVDIGEHASDNCPWLKALELSEEWQAAQAPVESDGG